MARTTVRLRIEDTGDQKNEGDFAEINCSFQDENIYHVFVMQMMSLVKSSTMAINKGGTDNEQKTQCKK